MTLAELLKEKNIEMTGFSSDGFQLHIKEDGDRMELAGVLCAIIAGAVGGLKFQFVEGGPCWVRVRLA